MAGSCVVFGNDIAEFSESVYGFMHAFVFLAGKRIRDKLFIKKRIKDSVNRVMQQPVSHAGLMNIPGLWVIDFELLIGAVFVIKID